MSDRSPRGRINTSSFLQSTALAPPLIIVPKQPEDSLRHLAPVVLQVRRLPRLVRVLPVLNPAALLPHLNLPLNHVLVEREVRLRREEPVGQVEPLHLGVVASPPALDGRVPLSQQARRGPRRGHAHDVVLMHLVEVDVGGVGAEEALTRGGELDGAVAQLPVAPGRGLDGRAEEAGQELVAEAHAREHEVWFPGPELW